ncbi:hypothetical protein V6C03_04730 [Methyloligella sp. 2.7D]|uniref:hypothetical protein n=1 Tax=unclassified Methyloligella TaxID=2625955 RepID=UPI00157D769E|nr:hypothetical protein [Methyloligella sp. GL2]QKP76101.1 hypothetical protein HT051_00700 [Methyloligella sp. GL2]
MLKRILMTSAVAGGLALSGVTAAAAAPLTVPAPQAQPQSQVLDVAYQCGAFGCVWVPTQQPGATYYAPGPIAPNCYWKQGLLGNWKQKCR